MSEIVAIFAHPDDESFGPGGTIAKFAKTNNVYLICVTSGDKAGEPTVREQELKDASALLGIKKVYFLRFADGELCNDIYHEIADACQKLLEEIKPQKLLTFEMRGVTGHIDHVATSMITTYLFYKLQYVSELWYYCISNIYRSMIKDYFIYFPSGYEKDEVDEVIDVSDVWNERMQSVLCHGSQEKDMKECFKDLNQLPKEEYFLVKRK
jgi:LmbE family N-acetylglucosaminyl deacetylase